MQQLEQQRQQQNEHSMAKQQKQIEELNSTARLQQETYTEQDYQKAFIDILISEAYPEATTLWHQNKDQLNEEIINLIVQKYIENEDKNFSLFNYANDLRAEVEKKEEELYKLKDELTLAKKKKEAMESGLKIEQELLKNQMNQIEQESKKFERDCEEMIKNMVGVFTQIEKLQDVTGLKPKEEKAETFRSTGVNPENVLVVLGDIENVIDQKVGRLLSMIKRKKLPTDTFAKYLFKEEGKNNVNNLAPAAAAIIKELNKEDF